MKHIRTFATENAYETAKNNDDLFRPSLSYITETGGVMIDEVTEEPPTTDPSEEPTQNI